MPEQKTPEKEKDLRKMMEEMRKTQQVWPAIGGVVAIVGTGIAWKHADTAEKEADTAHKQADIAYEQSDEYKIEQAVDKICMDFKACPPYLKVVARKVEVKRIKDRLTAGPDKRTTVVVGPFMAGKTTLIDQVLEQDIVKGIVQMTVMADDWQKELYAKTVGDIGGPETFAAAMKKAEKRIGQKPIVCLDIPRHSRADMGVVSTWCKDVTESGVAKVLVVASQMEMALGFDAGGKQRQFSMHIDNMTEEEAIEFLEVNFPKITKDEIKYIVNEVGTNPGRLGGVAEDITTGMNINAALEVNRCECAKEVEALLAIRMDGHTLKIEVGKEMAQSLVDSPTNEINHSIWTKKGFNVQMVAAKVKEKSAYAITYHFEKNVWHFASPMHKKETKKQLQSEERSIFRGLTKKYRLRGK
jgi:hypothetical protein